MEQHPIPQQISSYEFKLVGEMTLKQFLKAAAGIIIAMLFNATNIMILVKWPLMAIFAGGGLILAFVPLQDRPLEKWISSFIKAIYSPTIFIYKKSVDVNWLKTDFSEPKNRDEESAEENNNKGWQLKDEDKRRKISDYLKSLTLEEPKETEMEKGEDFRPDQKIIKSTVTDEPSKPVEVIKTEAQVKNTANDWKNQKTNLDLKTEKLEATGSAVFGTIPMPDIPDVPNVVVGMATDIQGGIVEGVIVEIQDEHGNPSRVLKTNSLGQFKTSTPLANGRYLMIAEKEGSNFDRVNIDLSGQIVKPIRIIASN